MGRWFDSDEEQIRHPTFQHSIIPVFPSLRPLLAMWLYPRLIAWFLATVALLVLARLPFARFQIIPHYLKFTPGVILVPLAGVFWGPAGAWGALAASLAGDRLTGMWGVLSPYRAAANFLFALSAQKLWDVSPRGEASLTHAPSVSHTLRFLLAAWPGCFAAAGWVALGCEINGFYPFPYIASLALAHNLAFVTLTGAAVYRLTARTAAPRFGSWREVMAADAGPATDPLPALVIWVGSLGACAAGWLAGALIYRMGPFEPFVIGITCGAWVEALVIPFLAVQVLGALGWPGRGRG